MNKIESAHSQANSRRPTETDGNHRRLRVTCVINGTGPGGAERMLGKVLLRADQSEFDLRVISLNEYGQVAQELEDAGIPVVALNILRRRLPNPIGMPRLVRRLRAQRPDVVQTWMYLSDLYGGIAAKLAGNFPVVWNIRHGTLDPNIDSRNMRWTARMCGMLSRRLPTRIVLNSETAKPVHIQAGYAADKIEVIPNGFDLEEFQPCSKAPLRIRAELGLHSTTTLVGLVGRFHPHKDHDSFIKAAALVLNQRPDVKFVLAGGDNILKQSDIEQVIAARGLQDAFHVTGARKDVAAINAALDVAVCSSLTEGFPNVVGEAMACGTPCVTTRVGDSALIVGDAGIVVPTRDPAALADGILTTLRMSRDERQAIGRAARKRITQHYDIRRIATRYTKLWREVSGHSQNPARQRAA